MVRITLKHFAVLLSVLLLLLVTACKPDENIDDPNLDVLLGSWIRIGGNNPEADGMIVKMDGASGTVTDKAGSGFNNNDLKWKDIRSTSSEQFTYEELGSDANYYSATMELRSDDTLRISVGSSGAGNIQKWVREGQYIPGQGPVNTQKLDCDVTTDLVLRNGTAAVDYLVDCVIDVTANLTIEPGVVIQVAENGGIGVYDNGSITAVGTSTEPILFSGTTHTQGWWRGVHIESNSTQNKFDFVTIEDAGSNYVYCCNEAASLTLEGAKMSMKNVTLKNGIALGLFVTGATTFTDYANIRIQTHKLYAASFTPKALTYLDGTDSDYSGNDKDYVYVKALRIDAATTWPVINVPYLLEGKVFDVTEPLTIEAGAEVICQENAGIGVYNEGSLTVAGTAAQPVIMRGFEPTKGYWRGLSLETNKIANDLNYLQLSDAGSNYVYCCGDPASIYLENGKASIKNTTISNGNGFGIYAANAFTFSGYEQNTISTHQQAPMYLAAERLSELDGRGSDYTGNVEDYIRIFDSNVAVLTTWKPANVPYLVDGKVIDITARLNILAGVEVVFKEQGGLGVYNDGILNGIGTATEKIIFRGADNIQGYWRGIHTETNSSNNVLRYVEIQNAGSNYVYCCNDPAGLFVEGGQITLEYSTVSDNAGCGVRVKSTATFTDLSNTYSNNASGDVCN